MRQARLGLGVRVDGNHGPSSPVVAKHLLHVDVAIALKIRRPRADLASPLVARPGVHLVAGPREKRVEAGKILGGDDERRSLALFEHFLVSILPESRVRWRPCWDSLRGCGQQRPDGSQRGSSPRPRTPAPSQGSLGSSGPLRAQRHPVHRPQAQWWADRPRLVRPPVSSTRTWTSRPSARSWAPSRTRRKRTFEASPTTSCGRPRSTRWPRARPATAPCFWTRQPPQPAPELRRTFTRQELRLRPLRRLPRLRRRPPLPRPTRTES